MAAGHWPGRMGPGYTDGLGRNGAHVFQLYDEEQNPKLLPPDFSYRLAEWDDRARRSERRIKSAGDRPLVA